MLARSGYITRLFAAKGATNYASVRPDNVLDLDVPLPTSGEQVRMLRILDSAAQAGAAAAEVGVEMATVLQEFRLASLAGHLRAGAQSYEPAEWLPEFRAEPLASGTHTPDVV